MVKIKGINNMLKKTLFLLCLAGAALLCAAPAGRFEPRPQAPRYCKVDKKKSRLLFEKGKANFQIVYGKSRWAMLGAVELANTLTRSLGVKVWASAKKKPGVPSIIVGDVEAAKKAGFDPEKMEWGAFRIKSVGNDIIIAGRDDGVYSEGTLYGVYDFLERFAGVRFYFPGEIGTVIQVGGKVIKPGDIILGDRDGVIAVDPADAPALIEATRAVQAKEEAIMAAMERDGTYTRPWVDEKLREIGCTDI